MLTNLKSFAVKLWKDESAQGATEYILLLVAIVGIMYIFRERVSGAMRDKIQAVTGDILNFKVQ